MDREFKITLAVSAVVEMTIYSFDEDESEDDIRDQAIDEVERGLTFSDGATEDVSAEIVDFELIESAKKV